MSREHEKNTITFSQFEKLVIKLEQINPNTFPSIALDTEVETFVKTGRCTNGLEKAMSHFSGSVAEFPEEVRDHLTQNDFLTFVAETEATFFISNGKSLSHSNSK